MTWFGDVVVKVEAEGGGAIEDVNVKLSHMKLDDSDNVIIDDKYEEFLEEKTDAYGEAVLRVRVQDSSWSDLTQHFRVDVEKLSEKSQTAS